MLTQQTLNNSTNQYHGYDIIATQRYRWRQLTANTGWKHFLHLESKFVADFAMPFLAHPFRRIRGRRWFVLSCVALLSSPFPKERCKYCPRRDTLPLERRPSVHFCSEYCFTIEWNARNHRC
mmetsp:Transcript_108473/g.221492  ORF Transcript_108473/g.221492 Transcript_108473/m.221492 type:complete len:122 (+) Transcript_108473:943-1308(+)